MPIKKYRIKKLDRRTHGFHKTPKSIFKLLSGNDKLTDKEFICYLYISSNLIEFNSERDVEFGTFDYSNVELAHGLGWTETKTHHAVKGLKHKGYIFNNKNDLLELTGYKLLHACIGQYSRKNNRISPHKAYIPFKEIIEYCKTHNLDLENINLIAKLQDIELELYLNELDIPEDYEDSKPP